jgi:hypothetical protein
LPDLPHFVPELEFGLGDLPAVRQNGDQRAGGERRRDDDPEQRYAEAVDTTAA